MRGQQRARLSAVVITKNEEPRIRALLESIAWVDEIIAVDDESTDRTRDMLRAVGAQVVVRSSQGQFDQQRNVGIEVAQGDWVLHLDADEVVPPALREEIQRVLQERNEAVAYRIARRNYFLGREMRYGGWNWHGIKLARRTAGWYAGRIHETLNVTGPIGNLTQRILHFPFQSLAQCVERQNVYTTLQAATMLETQPSVPLARVRYHLLRRPLKLFWKSYVKKRGWREGMHGLVFGAVFAWFEFLKWAKWWEQTSRGSDKAFSGTLEARVSQQNVATSLQAQQWLSSAGPLPVKRIRRRIWAEPLKAFWICYRREGGRLPKFQRLVRAEFEAGVELLRWAKHWELAHRAASTGRACGQPDAAMAAPGRYGREGADG